MALPTRNDAKSFLRIDTTAEDTLLDQLLARALALCERALGYPMTAASLTHVDYDELRPDVLELPGPFATGEDSAPVVTDPDDEEVDADDYYLDPRRRLIRAKTGCLFASRPYTIVASVGLSAHPDYAARLEAIASVAILDAVAHLYFHRDPSTTAETDEGGSSRSVEADQILPRRVLNTLALLPGGDRLR